jgi:ankyrin repeat protein
MDNNSDYATKLREFGSQIHYNNGKARWFCTSSCYSIRLVDVFNNAINDINYDHGAVLLCAIDHKKFNLVRFLVENGANLDNTNLIVECAMNGTLEIMRYLVDAGIDIHTHGSNALNEACSNNIEMVRYLVDNGIKIDDNVLIYTSELEIIRYLVEHGANVRANNDKVLRHHARRNDLDIVRYLVDNGADIHASNDEALYLSSMNESFDVVRYLIEMGVDIHAYDDIALKSSVASGNLEMTRYFIESGSNVNAIKYVPFSGYDIDDIREYIDMVRYLLTVGVDIQILAKNIQTEMINILKAQCAENTFMTLLRKDIYALSVHILSLPPN